VSLDEEETMLMQHSNFRDYVLAGFVFLAEIFKGYTAGSFWWVPFGGLLLLLLSWLPKRVSDFGNQWFHVGEVDDVIIAYTTAWFMLLIYARNCAFLLIAYFLGNAAAPLGLR
jgi:hypothetical protein